MDIQVSGIHIDVGDALRSHVLDSLESGVGKYFNREFNGHVSFAKEGGMFKCDANINLSSGISLQAGGKGGDAYGAFEDAAEHLEKRLRRYKRRLKDHHNNNKSALPAESVASYTIQPTEESGEEADLQPVIVAEHMTEIRTLSVGAAVMQMDLADSPVILFRTSSDGPVNIVYRRGDGNVGWIDTGSAAKS